MCGTCVVLNLRTLMLRHLPYTLTAGGIPDSVLLNSTCHMEVAAGNTVTSCQAVL